MRGAELSFENAVRDSEVETATKTLQSVPNFVLDLRVHTRELSCARLDRNGRTKTVSESLTPAQRAERGVPSKLLSTEEVAGMVVRLSADKSLNGRIVVWRSEDPPRLMQWGDRGYRNVEELTPSSD